MGNSRARIRPEPTPNQTAAHRGNCLIRNVTQAPPLAELTAGELSASGICLSSHSVKH